MSTPSSKLLLSSPIKEYITQQHFAFLHDANAVTRDVSILVHMLSIPSQALLADQSYSLNGKCLPCNVSVKGAITVILTILQINLAK